MKLYSEILKEAALECAEEHIDVLLDAELTVGDRETARSILQGAMDTFMAQFDK